VWSDERQAEIYQGEAVRAVVDGTIVIRLPTGLQKKAPSDAKPAKRLSRRTGETQTAAIDEPAGASALAVGAVWY
jgi:hypothetical protein